MPTWLPYLLLALLAAAAALVGLGALFWVMRPRERP